MRREGWDWVGFGRGGWNGWGGERWCKLRRDWAGWVRGTGAPIAAVRARLHMRERESERARERERERERELARA